MPRRCKRPIPRNRGFFLLALFVLALTAAFAAGSGEAAEITILHTVNVTGHLFPCPS